MLKAWGSRTSSSRQLPRGLHVPQSGERYTCFGQDHLYRQGSSPTPNKEPLHADQSCDWYGVIPVPRQVCELDGKSQKHHQTAPLARSRSGELR